MRHRPGHASRPQAQGFLPIVEEITDLGARQVAPLDQYGPRATPAQGRSRGLLARLVDHGHAGETFRLVAVGGEKGHEGQERGQHGHGIALDQRCTDAGSQHGIEDQRHPGTNEGREPVRKSPRDLDLGQHTHLDRPYLTIQILDQEPELLREPHWIDGVDGATGAAVLERESRGQRRRMEPPGRHDSDIRCQARPA